MTEAVDQEQPNPAENVLQADPAEPVVAAVEPAEPEPVVDPVVDQETEDKRKNPWFLKRISAEAEARRVAEQRATDAEAMLERLQKGKETPAAQPAAASPDFQTAVQREAARQRLSEDSTAIRDAGFRKFGAAFGENLAVLNAAGAVADDMVMDLIAVDKANAHEILASLAQDPERAASLAGMDSRRRTAELTRISMAINAPAAAAPKAATTPAKQVSKAPAPPPPVEPSASKVTDWRADDASDEDFDRGFRETMLKRSQRR